MRKVSIFKKISLFLSYIKIIKSLSRDLGTNFGARIDNAYRIYTVLNIPENLIEEPYNLRKADIDNLAKNFMRDYSNQLSRFLNENGLIELYDSYDVEKVDKYSYLMIFGFSLFNTQKFFRNLYLIYLPLACIILISLLIYFLNF